MTGFGIDLGRSGHKGGPPQFFSKRLLLLDGSLKLGKAEHKYIHEVSACVLWEARKYGFSGCDKISLKQEFMDVLLRALGLSLFGVFLGRPALKKFYSYLQRGICPEIELFAEDIAHEAIELYTAGNLKENGTVLKKLLKDKASETLEIVGKRLFSYLSATKHLFDQIKEDEVYAAFKIKLNKFSEQNNEKEIEENGKEEGSREEQCLFMDFAAHAVYILCFMPRLGREESLWVELFSSFKGPFLSSEAKEMFKDYMELLSRHHKGRGTKHMIYLELIRPFD